MLQLCAMRLARALGTFDSMPACQVKISDVSKCCLLYTSDAADE